MSRHTVITAPMGEDTIEEVQPNTLYFVCADDMYAFSPDGEGMYWYEEYDEFEKEHGLKLAINMVDEITDF